MTIPVVAVFVAKPGMEHQLEELFLGLIDTTLQEDGCISYQLNRDTQNPRRFVFTEVWESQAHLDRHSAAPHLQALAAQLPAYVESADVIVLEKLAGGAA